MINHEEFLNAYDRRYSMNLGYDSPNVSMMEAFKKLTNTHLRNVDSGLSTGLPEIRKVIFHDPATIIIWSDGSKSIVKCTKKDKYDPEKVRGNRRIMKAPKRACKGCRYCHPYYGNRNKTGKRTVSNYRCSKRNGICPDPKECTFRKEHNHEV